MTTFVEGIKESQERQEAQESPYQTEALFSEEDVAYAAKALESRMLGYEDESPFLNAFVQEETQFSEPEWQEAESYSYHADQEEPGQIAEWEGTLAPETGGCRCKQNESAEAYAADTEQDVTFPAEAERDIEPAATEADYYAAPDQEDYGYPSEAEDNLAEPEDFELYEPNAEEFTPALNFVQPPPNSPYYVQEAYARWQEEISASNPQQVRWLQDSLNKILGLRLKTDGIMGQQTRSAIITFQNRLGLKPDGIAGPKTEAAIKNALLASISIPPRTEPPYTTPALLSPPGGQTSQRTIYGWRQYQRKVEELPPDQQAALRDVGNTIIASYQPGGKPVKRVQVQGHADVDTPPNPQREQQYSQERTQMVTGWLKNYVGQYAAQITWETQGFGATRLKAEPKTEADRKQNRRVEILLFSQSNTIILPNCPLPPTKSPEFTRWLQRSLNLILNKDLPVNGRFCFDTQNSLMQFQAKSGLQETNTCDYSTYLKLRAAGASSAPCTISSVTPFPVKYKSITMEDMFFTRRLNEQIQKYLPSNHDIAISIVRLEPDPETFGLCVTANYNSDIMHFSGSLLKVVIAYASYELLRAANRLAEQTHPANTAELISSLESCFTNTIVTNFDQILQDNSQSISKTCPPQKNTKPLQYSHKKPNYDKLFVLSGLAVEFTSYYQAQLKTIFSNPDWHGPPMNCVHCLGYGYIVGALEKSGLFKVSGAKGIWLGADYSGRKEWPYICVDSQNDGLVGYAMTTGQMANLFALLYHKRLFRKNISEDDKGYNNAMLNLLSIGGSWLQPHLDKDRILFTHTKVGHGPGKPGKPDVYSSGEIFEYRQNSASTEIQRYIVIWQNCPSDKLFKNIASIIKDTIPYP